MIHFAQLPDSASPPPKRSYRSRLILLLLSLLVVVACAEIAIRVAGYGTDRGPCFQGYNGAGIRLMCYDRNPEGYFDVDLSRKAVREKFYKDYGVIDMEKTWRYTPYGVMTPCDHNEMRPGQVRPRTPGKIRLVAVGDSFTYGHALKPGDPWPEQLERMMNQTAAPPKSDGRFEVLNFGIGDRDIPQIAGQLTEKVLPAEPNAVVYGWYLNDPVQSPNYVAAYRDLLGGLRTTARHIPNQYISVGWREITGARRWCAIYDLIEEKVGNRGLGLKMLHYTNDAYGPANADGWAQSEQLLADMADACRRRGVALHVAIWPMLVELGDEYPFVAAHQAIVEACRKANVPVVDLRDRLRAYPPNRLILHYEDRHPNRLACRLAAEAIAEHLRKHHADWFR